MAIYKSLAGDSHLAAKVCTHRFGEFGHALSRLRRNQWRTLVGFSPMRVSRLPEICSVQQQVSFTSPCPLTPYRFWNLPPVRHLLTRTIWGDEPISLADDGGAVATSDGVRLPLCVVVVDHMNEPKSHRRQPLCQSFSEMVVRKGHLHYLVLRHLSTCTKKQSLYNIQSKLQSFDRSVPSAAVGGGYTVHVPCRA